MFLGIVVTLLTFFGPSQGPQQAASSLDSDRLLEAVKTRGLSAEETVSIIRRRGLSFEMSADLERRFREAGADNAVVDALWDKETWVVPAGPALTRQMLVTFLQTGIHPRRLSKLVMTRKVDIDLAPAAIKELQAAGANDQMIVLITSNNVCSTCEGGVKKTYAERIAAARAALKRQNYDTAESEANAAKLLDESRPEAYSIIGYVNLYHFDSFLKADKEYRAALDRGGEVEFRVQHEDHGSKPKYCTGKITLKKGSVNYEASRPDHNLPLDSQKITEARMHGGVHVFVSQGGDKPMNVVFRSARNKNQGPEERLLADLINFVRR